MITRTFNKYVATMFEIEDVDGMPQLVEKGRVEYTASTDSRKVARQELMKIVEVPKGAVIRVTQVGTCKLEMPLEEFIARARVVEGEPHPEA